MKTAKIEKPSYGLEFCGVTEDGEKVLVPFTAVGEVWNAEHLKGNVYKPLRPLKLNDEDRRDPPCGHFPLCFNCQWMHLRPETQSGYKVKLFEELLTAEEGTDKTLHKKIYIARSREVLSEKELNDILYELWEAINKYDKEQIRKILEKYVPFFKDTSN